VALVVLGPRLLGASAPEGEVLTALKILERQAPQARLSFGVLYTRSLQYQRMEARVEPDGQRAWVTATLDLEAALQRAGDPEATRVSSLGLERVPFVRRGASWEPEAGGWPRLTRGLEALERRRVALEAAAGPGVTGRHYTALAWYVRSEREGLAVAEDWRLEEDGPDRRRDQRGTTRLELRSSPDGGFEWQE
jgi:hypothetical protein